MKKILLSLAMIVCAAPAFAGGDLTWTRCVSSTAGPGTADIAFDCADPSFIADLFATWQSPEAIGPGNLVTNTVIIDTQTAAPVLPPFWSFDLCGSVPPASHVRPGTSLCNAVNWLGAGGANGDNNRSFQTGVGGPHRGRLRADTFRAIDDPYQTAIALNANVFAVKFSFSSASALEAGGTCAGCPQPIALVLNETILGLLAGAAGGASPEAREVSIIGPGAVGACATVGGAGSICNATPVKSRTWGALKSLYR